MDSQEKVTSRFSSGIVSLAGIVSLLVLLGVSAFASLWSLSMVQGRLEEMGGRTTRRVALASTIQLRNFQAFGGEKIMILAGFDHDKALQDQWRQRVADTRAQVEKDIDDLSTLMRAESGRQAAASLREGVVQWGKVHEEVRALLDAGRLGDAQQASLRKGRPLVEANERAAQVIADNQNTFVAEDLASAAVAYSRSRWAILTAAVLSVCVAAFVMMVVVSINRTLRQTAVELSEVNEQVVAASAQVSGAAQSLSQGSTQQAASLEETSAAMEEMASMTRKNAESSRRAAELMADVDKRVAESNVALDAMVASMTNIRASSDRVAKIIKTIDEIAFQTNILALNAAVEAARAGDAGMGFAVVADEVRNLAQRSADAAKNTADLIEEAIGHSRAGSAKMDLVTGSISAITESVTSVKTLVDEVSVASSQQSQGIDQVAQAITQMEKVTQSTAAAAEESAAAGEELNAQAEASMAVARRLAAMVRAETHGSASDASRTSTGAGAHGRVVKFMRGTARRAVRSAEEELPLESGSGTGTYGTF